MKISFALRLMANNNLIQNYFLFFFIFKIRFLYYYIIIILKRLSNSFLLPYQQFCLSTKTSQTRFIIPNKKNSIIHLFFFRFGQKTILLDIPYPIKPDNLSVNKICISEPDDCNSKTPLTPEIMDRTPDEKTKQNQLTPTINEENEQDDQSVSGKSALSLPVEPPTIGPVDKDRRKLSVQGLMAFAERRRSSSTFSDMRKMSISNGDSIHIRSPGGTGKLK